jgi:hypothetical protein
MKSLIKYPWVSRIVLKSTIAAIVALVLLCIGYKPSSACTPVPITPWFEEKLSFVESNLPPTINHSSELTFTNTEDSPFYFHYGGETKDFGTQLSFRLYVSEVYDGIEINDYYFNEFEHRNKIGDDRPENTQPPGYQDVIIPLTLDNKQYEIKLRITYKINQYYNPKSIEMQDITCPYENPIMYYCLNTPVIIGFLFLTALVILVIIIKQRPSSKPDNQNRE